MGLGQEVILDIMPGRPLHWTGIVHDVPVNWPANDQPHYVRVRDPHLIDTSTAGLTAARLIVGGQSIYFYDELGTPDESGPHLRRRQRGRAQPALTRPAGPRVRQRPRTSASSWVSSRRRGARLGTCSAP